MTVVHDGKNMGSDGLAAAGQFRVGKPKGIDSGLVGVSISPHDREAFRSTVLQQYPQAVLASSCVGC
eukprot:SAG31_NODE_15326_length_760_cov_1.276853_2_plen_67_part_00